MGVYVDTQGASVVAAVVCTQGVVLAAHGRVVHKGWEYTLIHKVPVYSRLLGASVVAERLVVEWLDSPAR